MNIVSLFFVFFNIWFSNGEEFSSHFNSIMESPITNNTGIGAYIWEGCGLGFNLNTVLNSWLYFFSIKEWHDFSIIIEKDMLSVLECSDENSGIKINGWGCLFNEIPHLNIVNSTESLDNYDMPFNIINEENMKVNKTVKRSGKIVEKNLNEYYETDILNALSVIYTYIWSYMTPWLKRDINLIESNIFNEPYIGLHIRRGDKVIYGEAKAVEVEEYLMEAKKYVNNIDEIKGIWVASDDMNVINEVRDLSSIYFPNILKENIIYATSEGINEKKSKEWSMYNMPITTRSKFQEYKSFVYLFSDIERLSNAEVFVGTFSSNMGRIVHVARESKNKPRNSSRSLDVKWHPGRH